jgi:molybdopterin converting factor small subunit
MGIQQTYAEKPGPETIWAILREVSQVQKELSEQMKETDKQIKENYKQIKETDRQMKETDRQLGFMGNRFGEILEYLIKPNLLKSFRELGFAFTRVHYKTLITDEKNRIITEVDYTLENGDKVICGCFMAPLRVWS